MTEHQEKELMSWIAQHTLKAIHIEDGQPMYGIKDMSWFVKNLMEFIESKKYGKSKSPNEPQDPN